MSLLQSLFHDSKRTPRYTANLSAEIIQTLEELERLGRITERDEALLPALAAGKLMSEDQIARSWFSLAKNPKQAARGRLYKLKESKLVDHPRRGRKVWHVSKKKMVEYGLTYSTCYLLTDLGRAWLIWRGLDPGQKPEMRVAIHDLLVSEVMTRLRESLRPRGKKWRMKWDGAGPAGLVGDDSGLAPAGLGVVRGPFLKSKTPLAFFLEIDLNVTPEVKTDSALGRHLNRYNQQALHWYGHASLQELTYFPIVLIVIHAGEPRRQALANLIHRQPSRRVHYGLALREDLFAGTDFLTQPAWMWIAPGARASAQKKQLPLPRTLLDSELWQAVEKSAQTRPAAPPPEPDLVHSELWQPLEKSTQTRPAAPPPEPDLVRSELWQVLEKSTQVRPAAPPPEPDPVPPSPPPLLLSPMRVRDRLLGAAGRNQIEATWDGDMSRIAVAFESHIADPPLAIFRVTKPVHREFAVELETSLSQWRAKVSAYRTLFQSQTTIPGKSLTGVIILSGSQERLDEALGQLAGLPLPPVAQFFFTTTTQFEAADEVLFDPIFRYYKDEKLKLSAVLEQPLQALLAPADLLSA